jgi:hypothetical protein
MASAGKVSEDGLWEAMGDAGFRSNRERSGNCTMTRRTRRRVLGSSVIGALVAVGTGLVYRAFVDRWEGDVRAPLIAALMAGIAFFVLTLITLSWVERRENANRREPQN